MNNFQEMWDFDVREGVDFLHCNRVHPLMQTRVQNLLKELKQDKNINKIVLFGSSLEFRCSSYSDIDLYKEALMSLLPKKERQKCSIFDMNCYYIMFENKLKRQENTYESEVRPVKTES